MDGCQKLTIPTIDPNMLIDEIKTTFRDIPPGRHPRPSCCAPKNYIAYGESERLEYLEGKAWLEIAENVIYMRRHAIDQFLGMKKQCFFYLLPGYLIGATVHPPESTAHVTQSLLCILVVNTALEDIRRYVFNRLTVSQKRAVAHWLLLVLRRDQDRCPELYIDGATPSLALWTFRDWQQWA